MLLALYGCPISEASRGFETVCTNGLPEHHVTADQQRSGKPGKLRPNVEVSLWNLARLGMLAPGGGWGGISTVFTVTRTALGHAFLAATTTEADCEAHRPTAFQAPDDTGAWETVGFTLRCPHGPPRPAWGSLTLLCCDAPTSQHHRTLSPFRRFAPRSLSLETDG